MGAWVYILRLKSGGLYIGVTTDLDSRLKEHMNGHGGRTTRLDQPTKLIYQECFSSLDEAEVRENQLKHWTRAKKEALIRGDVNALKTLSRRRTP